MAICLGKTSYNVRKRQLGHTSLRATYSPAKRNLKSRADRIWIVGQLRPWQRQLRAGEPVSFHPTRLNRLGRVEHSRNYTSRCPWCLARGPQKCARIYRDQSAPNVSSLAQQPLELSGSIRFIRRTTRICLWPYCAISSRSTNSAVRTRRTRSLDLVTLTAMIRPLSNHRCLAA